MIQTLNLQNFKCFENQTLEFGRLTLLSGLNGMGKSSVLQSLLLLRQSYEQGLLPGVGLALNGELVKIGTGQDALFDEALEDKISFGLKWTEDLAANWSFIYDREADVINLASTTANPATATLSLFNEKFHYLQAERIGPRTSFEMSDFVVRQRKQLGTQGEFAAYFLSIFGTTLIPNPALIHRDVASLQLKDQVEAWLGEISPGTRLNVIPYATADLTRLEYSFVSRGQAVSNPYRPTNVGFGITYVLPILVAVLSATPDTLILLENPEAHLHPRGQAQIGALLARAASGGVQVIVETHSDHILNGMRVAVHDGEVAPENIRLHYFERRQDVEGNRAEVISPRIDRDGRIDYWPDGFFDQWRRSLEDLM